MDEEIFTQRMTRHHYSMKTLSALSALGVLLIIFCLSACQESPEERYKKMEQAALSSGIRYDMLFKGIYLSMEEKEFYHYCYQMNLKDEFRQGGVKNGNWVEYKLKDEMKYPAAINFFPIFENNTITELKAAIYYDNAELKDKVFESDSLLLDVLQLMEKWYGQGFIKIESPFAYKDDIYVKIDGNRRITVLKDQSGQMINLWFVDMLAQEPKALHTK